eukprot:TRINITY_DN39037_c0_g1_i2.p1 TRINITY_DN39037_c0_g1~~TRINITY_DN39037_c0_g1_i2.p1  ORF type:complete len:392 (+),score=94.92 TRINITY_DN39037_c0_g1_i2:207-1382(+)
MRQAVALDSSRCEWKIELARVTRQKDALDLASAVSNSTHVPPVQQVVRCSAKDLSSAEFIARFASKGVPVVITDSSPGNAQQLSLDHLKIALNTKTVRPKHTCKDSVCWARLEDGAPVQMGDFLNSIQNDSSDAGYLHDWSLPQNAPDVLSELSIPKYFAADWLQRVVNDSMYRDSWPSLFVGPAGSRSELHVDGFGSNFWMKMFQGRKRWVLFDQRDVHWLEPSYHEGSLDPVFGVCAEHLEAREPTPHTTLRYAQRYECELHPGELLFVPAGTPHFVQNLEASVAISANYVDQSNAQRAIQELQLLGLRDNRAAQLAAGLQQLRESTECDQVCEQDVPWGVFKRGLAPLQAAGGKRKREEDVEGVKGELADWMADLEDLDSHSTSSIVE